MSLEARALKPEPWPLLIDQLIIRRPLRAWETPWFKPPSNNPGSQTLLPASPASSTSPAAQWSNQLASRSSSQPTSNLWNHRKSLKLMKIYENLWNTMNVLRGQEVSLESSEGSKRLSSPGSTVVTWFKQTYIEIPGNLWKNVKTFENRVKLNKTVQI